MATIGNEKQEQKIGEFAKMAKQLFPDVSELSIKGALRYGAKSAIEKSQLSSWGEMAEKPATERKKFFDLLLQEARPHLVNVIGAGKIDEFLKRVREENEKYLKG